MHWGRLRLCALVTLILSFSIGAASAEKRVALIIGNSNYQSVAKLPNPAGDATAIAAMFRQAHFDLVESKLDLNNTSMRRAVREFTLLARDADIAVVYFAGHGIEFDGINYLIPVDAKLRSDVDVEDETISLGRIMRMLESVRHLRLVILDACRDNPFTKTMTRTVASRSIGRGLGKIEVESTDTLVAFAAKAGSMAADGGGKHSPFTAALLHNLATPGLDLRIALGRVRDEVLEQTGNRQEPYVYGSLGGSTVTLVPAKPIARVTKPVQPSMTASEALVRDYQFAERIGTIQAWDAFLAVHKSGFYAGLAHAARDKVIAAVALQKRENEARKKAAEEEKAAEAAHLRAAEEAKLKAAADARAKAEAEAKRQAAADAERQAAAEAKHKAETEAKQKAEADARAKAEAKRQAAADARRQAEAEAKRKAEAEAAQKAEADARAKAKAVAEEEARLKAKLDADTQKQAAPIVVASAPSASPVDHPHPTAPAVNSADIARLLQVELNRVGCNPGKADGHWSGHSAHAMQEYNKHARTKFDVKVASLAALDAVKVQKARICPLVCGRGYKAEKDSCVRIACKHGYIRNRAGECERPAKTAARPPSQKSQKSQKKESGGSGKIICDSRTGCRAVPKNCRLVSIGSPGGSGHMVCD
jgi:Caspase domain